MIDDHDLPPLCLPVLAVLASRPQTIWQIKKLLMLNPVSIARRLKDLEAAGWVVKRSDNRWQMVVRLKPEPVKPVVPDVPPAHQDAPGTIVQVPEVPEFKATHLDPTAGRDSGLATHFRVPVELIGRGLVGAGTIAPCTICNKSTPLKYGGQAICPTCARRMGNGQ